MKPNLKENKNGITLIALIITIIVLLILAGVSITTLTGENGILNRAINAREVNDKASAREEIQLGVIASYGVDGNVDNELIKENLNKINGIEGVPDIITDTSYPLTVKVNGKSFEIKKNGVVDKGIDWENAKKIAKAPNEQVTTDKKVIGIGTDGNAVNMDLWEFELLNDNTYKLNKTTDVSSRTSSYKNEKVEDGKIVGTVPMYISEDNGKNFKPVTDMYATFLDCTNLITAPVIPKTVINMESTFQGCTSLKAESLIIPVGVKYLNYTFQSTAFSSIKSLTIPKSVIEMKGTFAWNSELLDYAILPDNVEDISYLYIGCSKLKDGMEEMVIPKTVANMQATFSRCTSIESAPIIPEGVTNMKQTFSSCSSLKKAPNIPTTVADMSQTFNSCTNLQTPPEEIPSSVKNMYRTFFGCNNIYGSMKINASLTGENLSNGFVDYYQCFWSATTVSKKNLTLNCKSDIYNLFYDSTTKNNIKPTICYEALNISLVEVK